MSNFEASRSVFERPIKADIDRTLSILMHEARHKLMEEQAQIISNAAAHGALQSSRVVVLAIDAADKIHAAAMKEAAPLLRDFFKRMDVDIATLIGWARPHLENLNNSILGVIKPNGFPTDLQRLVAQYSAVFQQRIDGALRDLEIGYVRGAGFSARTEMLDQNEWISAAQAMELASSVMGQGRAARAICARAHAGLIVARAARFIKAGQISNNVDVPAEFWWAEGDAALSQNWVTGDFETWINQTLQLKAYDVSFRLSDIEQLIPEKLAHKTTANTSSVNAIKAARGSNKVFIVHGHDGAALHELARFLEKIGLKPIILKEQPDQGRTIIEKFEELAKGVVFAVVLMTPDDLGGLASSSEQATRARQNVIFELGFFSGVLGRGHVCLLRKGNIEIPSDLFGIIYTDMDDAGAWKAHLIGEFKAAALEIDANQMWS
jgi:predicted nucleotide-binding protein